jgi:hypothetical protein
VPLLIAHSGDIAMTREFAEILIIVATTIEAGILMFVSEVIQKVMNEMDAATFKAFLGRLEHRAMRSPTALAASLVTTIACIPYFIYFGFGNRWFTAGIVVWFLSAAGSKVLNLPIYNSVGKLPDTETIKLEAARKKLQSANVVRASTILISVVLMVVGLAR